MKLLTNPQYRYIELFLHSLLGLRRKQSFTAKQVKDETKKVLEVLYNAENLSFNLEDLR